MRVWSPKIKNGEKIPNIYTCKGKDISPPILWEDVPDKTESFALISSDPDAPMGTWIHWLIYDIPKNVRSLPEGIPQVLLLPDGSKQGKNDFGNIGYGGPCPPPGKYHRYFFKLYALDKDLSLPERLTEKELLAKIKKHIIEIAEFYGIFSR